MDLKIQADQELKHYMSSITVIENNHVRLINVAIPRDSNAENFFFAKRAKIY